ncbi:hypothetical protein BAE29_12310 [Acidithiobacillus caldus]|uniref:Uncharacterized protein n=1 Tax=Acidithiobacillus caldus TaxID=33059 RepID=A0A1E7YKV6_9PROT|nr:hypothetical protein BAE28_16135 [Acidithiobacillus caldus]OFC30765.1 hypothetical protein BAE27_11030 [Acidithiobacillus caldus]OFC36820.1 hypothetical protein BAE29_12310 [Acidithiobacillus caldus]
MIENRQQFFLKFRQERKLVSCVTSEIKELELGWLTAMSVNDCSFALFYELLCPSYGDFKSLGELS